MERGSIHNRDVQFLLSIQKLLAEGIFTATYKFALLTAIADICIEKGHDSDDPLEIHTYEIAGKFIEYYWNHSTPFRDSVLVQSTGRPAAVISKLEKTRGQFRSLQALRTSPEWMRIVRNIAGIVKGMPLWKLQTVRSGQSEFIYQNRLGANSITLLPGVCRSFRLFHGLITDIVRGAWMEFIRKLPINQRSIGPHGDLEQFLFGESRSPLTALREPLSEIQRGDCFYCRRPLRDSVDVDHFIPWSMYRRDLGHNFVLAHKRCNGSKSAMLAGQPHIDAWLDRNASSGSDLAACFEEFGILHDLTATNSIARHAYHQASLMRSSLWIKNGETMIANLEWKMLGSGSNARPRTQ